MTATELLQALRPVAYTMDSESHELTRRYGFIAQELERVLPDLVFNSTEAGTKGVLYQDLIAILVEAVQEQAHENHVLKQALLARDRAFDAIRDREGTLVAQVDEGRQALATLSERLAKLEMILLKRLEGDQESESALTVI
jgi:hypothetical protein